MADIAVETLKFLASNEGRDAYEFAAGIEIPLLNRIERLRKRFSPEIADALVSLIELREKGKVKFELSDKMFFTKESLEQASDQTIAAYRAARFAHARFSEVADFCCGIGGDTIQLAKVCSHVTAIDKNPLMIEMTRLNVAAYGVERRVSFQLADLEEDIKLPDFDAIFIDPSRRVEGKRVLSLADSQPSINIINRSLMITPNIAVKCAPSLRVEELDFACPVGVEFISHEGVCKEAVLWFGEFAFDGIRATLLPERETFSSSLTNAYDDTYPEVPIREPTIYLYEPDNAVIAGGLVAPLAAELGLSKISDAIAYLCGDDLVKSPFVEAFRVISFMPLNIKQINKFLRDYGVGRVTIKRRGCPMEPDALQKKLRLDRSCSKHLFLVMTRIRERPSVVICDRVEPN